MSSQQWQLTPHNTGTPTLTVIVVADFDDSELSLTYQVLDKSPMQWEVFDIDNVKHCDFLWEKACFECFIAIDDKAYFEMNASPNGAFALYHFDNYRTPNQIPPRATDAIDFVWQSVQTNQQAYFLGSGNTPQNTALLQSTFNLKLTLPHTLTPSKLNPTAILYKNGEPIFYAVQHANPPDFHNKAFWQGV